MYESLTDRLTSYPNSINFLTWGYFYFSNIEIHLKSSDIRSIFSNYVVVIKVKEKIAYNENSIEKESRSTIFSFSGNIDVKINQNDKVVIINTDIFSGFCEVNKIEGIITNQYSDFISDLFDQISKPEEQVNEILAIVNLSMIQLKKNDSKLPINKLIRIIKENMKDRDFDLDALCEKAFVSRRKCQYIFSNHGTTFYAELKKARVENIRFEVMADSGSGTLEGYVSKSGFKNIASANKSFNEIVGQKLREFIKSQRTT